MALNSLAGRQSEGFSGLWASSAKGRECGGLRASLWPSGRMSAA